MIRPQTSHSVIKARYILGGAGDQLRALHLGKAGLRFLMIIADASDALILLTQQECLGEPEAHSHMKRINLGQHVCAQAVTPSRKDDAQAKLLSAFTAKNPDAIVPLLELDDGTCISHCNAITEYIDQRFDGPSLFGTTPTERATIQMMNLRAQEGLLDALVAYFHHATPGLGPLLETRQLPEWGLRQCDRAIAAMHYLNGILATRPYLAGASFSVADITAFTRMNFADAAKVAVPAQLADLAAWRERIAKRPSCAAPQQVLPHSGGRQYKCNRRCIRRAALDQKRAYVRRSAVRLISPPYSYCGPCDPRYRGF
jgi:glutathione S-transferase